MHAMKYYSLKKIMGLMHNVLVTLVDFFILVFEFMGVGIIIVSGIYCFLRYIKRDPYMRLNLAKGMAVGLEFKLGSEILRTVIVRDLSEIAIVGAIIALRAALALLIHWEIKVEEQHHKEAEHQKAIADHEQETVVSD